MPGQNINKKLHKPKILLVPLDWGLGHATRCIPLVKALLEAGADVILGASGPGHSLLQQEFPLLQVLQAPAYNIRYSKNPAWLQWALLKQLPRALSVMKAEGRWLEQVIEEHQPVAVISDNRFGLAHPKLHSVIITHQLHIETGSPWLNRMLQKVNHHYLNRFDACWVPDAEGLPNLAGNLSHPVKKPSVPVRYIGPLSRFSGNGEQTVTETNRLLFLLSGPEPQRSMLEQQAMQWLQKHRLEATLVRGLPNSNYSLPLVDNAISIYNHLDAEKLEKEIRTCGWMIARCGYSTVMDLAVMGKKALLIPTPRQTEQEYLAGHLKKMNAFAIAGQEAWHEMSPVEVLQMIDSSNITQFPASLQVHVRDWLQSL